MYKIYFYRVPGAYGAGNAIHGFYMGQFLLVRTKQFIPEYKNLPIVFINVLLIDGMVYTMMRRRYDNLFQPTHFIDVLCVIPELRKQVKRRHDANHFCRHTQQCCRQ